MTGAAAFPAAARILAAATAAIACVAVAGQLWLMLGNTAASGIGPATAVWRFLGFFTILTNILVMLGMAGIVAGRIGPGAPVALTGLAMAIGLVGVVYHAILAALWSPTGLQWWVDQALHTATPVLTVAFWAGFVDKRALRYADALRWMAWPSAYAVYALARGGVDGWFPYPFIDAGRIGWPMALLNACGLAVAFLVAGLLLVFVSRWVTRTARPG